MNQYAISTPEGTRDRLFAATRMFRQNEKRIRDLFEARGYDEIITPSLEYYDVFTQAGSSIGQEKMYKLTDRNGRLLVLRASAASVLHAEGTPRKLVPPRTFNGSHAGRCRAARRTRHDGGY